MGGHIGPPLRKKNPLPFLYSLSSANFAVLSQKETGFKRVETLVSTLLPSRRDGANRSRRPQTAKSPLRFSENLPARTGRIANATRVPHKPVQKRRCPDRVNRLRGSGAQPSLCRKMGAQKISDKTKQARIKPSLLCCDREV